ncbi:DUF3500 domain-containing protein [Streptomyces sp. NPDC088810]|uniref:DUF3500 domain-containing protein n=1 Tax=Streptomyces sp. NPDC088810 TaxID=3365904 RepID=UPI0037FCE923
MQLVASGLSEAGFATVATVMGLENILDQVEDWKVNWGLERGRDPGLYWLRLFGRPGDRIWAWRLGGHHISLNNLMEGAATIRPTAHSLPGLRPESTALSPGRC